MNHSRLDLVFTAPWVTAQLQGCFTAHCSPRAALTSCLSQKTSVTLPAPTPALLLTFAKKPKLQTSLRADLLMQRRGRRTQRALPAFYSSLHSVTVFGAREGKAEQWIWGLHGHRNPLWMVGSCRQTMLKEAVLLEPFII